MNAVSLRPQLNFHDLGKTRDISKRVPRFHLAEEMSSFATKSRLGEMRRSAALHSQQISANQAQQAQIRGMASQTGIPLIDLNHLMHDMPQDLPDGVRENAALHYDTAEQDAANRHLQDVLHRAAKREQETKILNQNLKKFIFLISNFFKD